jgi:hypothetical protein
MVPDQHWYVSWDHSYQIWEVFFFLSFFLSGKLFLNFDLKKWRGGLWSGVGEYVIFFTALHEIIFWWWSYTHNNDQNVSVEHNFHKSHWICRPRPWCHVMVSLCCVCYLTSPNGLTWCLTQHNGPVFDHSIVCIRSHLCTLAMNMGTICIFRSSACVFGNYACDASISPQLNDVYHVKWTNGETAPAFSFHLQFVNKPWLHIHK